MIVPLHTQHADQVAALHIAGIPTGFISSLGIKFVTALYRAIAESPYGFGYVEVIDEKVVGFVAFTTNLKGLYKTICRRSGLRFFFLLSSRLISLRTLKKIFETLFYPNKVKTPDLPQAELLSIAVSQTERGKGIAGKLILHGLAESHNAGIDRVKVLVADFNQPANRLYRKTGFEFCCQVDSHGVASNIYVAATGG